MVCVYVCSLTQILQNAEDTMMLAQLADNGAAALRTNSFKWAMDDCKVRSRQEQLGMLIAAGMIVAAGHARC